MQVAPAMSDMLIRGENLVKYASIINDQGRAAARTGMGAVMGSKKLKAIRVTKTEEHVSLAHEEAFRDAVKRARDLIKDDYSVQEHMESGTAGAVDVQSAYFGGLTGKYFSEGEIDCYKISGTTMKETLLVGSSGCYCCFVKCGRVIEIPAGKYKLPGRVRGPEYETMGAFGSSLLNFDLKSIAYANYLCDDYGLDTLSGGLTIALSYLLYEKGLLDRQTAGLELRWGDPDPAICLIEKIARREGAFGYLLGEGSRAVAEHFKVPELCGEVKGLEVTFQDPRAYSGMAMIYATGPRGGCHTNGEMMMIDMGLEYPEINVKAENRFENARKAAVSARLQDFRAFTNCLIACYLYFYPVSVILELYRFATGRDLTIPDMMTVGDRIFTLKRLFNCKMGVVRTDDRLPPPFLQPLKGSTEGHVPDVALQLKEYYAYRQWDGATERC